MSVRGEYRPIYEALWDGPDFQSLSPPARLVLLALKGKLGCAGIKAVPGLMGATQEWTGLEPDTIGACLGELRNAGWIETERSVVWVVRGLEFEPTMTASNAKHRAHIERVLASLPRLNIITRYAARYSQWVSKGYLGTIGSLPDGLRITTTTTTPSTTTSPTIATQSAEPGSDEPTDGQVLAHERATLWAPDGKPPSGWSEGQSVTVYRAQRKLGATGFQLLAVIDGLAALRKSGEPEWLAKGPKCCIKAINHTYNGLRPMWDVALEAGQRAPPKGGKRGQPVGIADLLPKAG